MRIVERRRTFIHTHFVTDGRRLPSARVREIERGITPVLRELGIVFGVHLAPPSPPGGIEVVVECIPGEAEMTRIEEALRRIVEPIPVRPPTTVVTLAGEP
jgi:hypothetical protein